jgi:hypothetical protein
MKMSEIHYGGHYVYRSGARGRYAGPVNRVRVTGTNRAYRTKRGTIQPRGVEVAWLYHDGTSTGAANSTVPSDDIVGSWTDYAHANASKIDEVEERRLSQEALREKINLLGERLLALGVKSKASIYEETFTLAMADIIKLIEMADGKTANGPVLDTTFLLKPKGA